MNIKVDLHMANKIKSHKDLDVYKLAMEIFEMSKSFPKEEVYSLTGQIRRSSRSVCANLAESFRKRRYKAAFIAKLSDAETEASETQVWLDFAEKCRYISEGIHGELYKKYDYIIGKIVRMINNPDSWTL